MGFLLEIRSRARHVLGPVLGICAVSYFAYHALHGDRGVIAWRQLVQKVREARSEAEEVGARRRVLENRVRLLHPDNLDPDMLEERARLMLNYGYDDDIVIFYDKPLAKSPDKPLANPPDKPPDKPRP